MFFPKLRARAKWVFLFLAITFAASFVLFGVGTGFGGLQDIILQDRTAGGGPSEDESRERTQQNPNDAQAWRDLATALQNQGKTEESLQPLARYAELRPTDIEAQRELAGLYLQQANRYRFEAQVAQVGLQQDVPGTTFQPPSSSKIGQALATNPLNDALSAEHNAALTQAFTRLNESYTKAVAAYKKVAAAEPNDAAVQFELAQTAEAANQTETAIAAYKRFLELAPEDQTADAVRERIKLLESQLSAGVGG
jgi:tetratricopeptide (TPR) repeat protein